MTLIQIFEHLKFLGNGKFSIPSLNVIIDSNVEIDRIKLYMYPKDKITEGKTYSITIQYIMEVNSRTKNHQKARNIITNLVYALSEGRDNTRI